MKSVFLFSMLLAALVPPPAAQAGERNLLQNAAGETFLEESLLRRREWVPYPDYGDRAGWDALTGGNRPALVRRGEKALDFEWKVVRATDYLEYERSGNRRIMEERCNANVKTLSDLVVAELAEGKGRFTDQIVNGAFHLCEMTSWALSAHTPLQRSKRSLPDKDDHVLALVSCEVGALLAWTDYFFAGEFDRIDPVISARIRREVKERILDTYLREDRFWWMGFRPHGSHTLNNWNPWCNCNVLQCFLLLEDDPARLTAAVRRTMRSVDMFLNYIRGDGACEEGPAYWEAAAGKVHDYLQVLSWATGGRVSLFDRRMIRDMGEYIVRSYAGNGWVVNFADASAKGPGQAPLIYRYGRAIGSEAMTRFAALLVREKRSGALAFGRDMLRNLENIRCCRELESAPAAMPEYDVTWYPETQFCYLRSGRFFLAAKGGHNNESHNHNDVGSCILYADNQPVLIDAGVGTYTRQTFGPERYRIWTMQSDYHNLPKINGFAQCNGARYRASEVRFDGKRPVFALDIAGAYPAEAGIRSWRRGYRIASREVVVTDAFALDNPSAANELHFMSWGEADTSHPGQVKIATPAGKRVVVSYDASGFDPRVETIELTDPRLSKVWGSSLLRVTLRAKRIEAKGRYEVRIGIAE